MLKLMKFLILLFASLLICDVAKIVLNRKTLKTAIDLRRRLNPVIKIRLPPPCKHEEGIIPILTVPVKEKFYELASTLKFLENFSQSNSSEPTSKDTESNLDFNQHDLDEIPQKESVNDKININDSTAVPAQDFNLDKHENNIYQPIINEIKEIENSRQCDIDRFEERLEAVESTLKSTENVTKQWGERIDQAENELVSLHSHMYTILSKTQLNAENLDKNEENFFKNFVHVPDVIPDMKNSFEEVLKSTWNGSGDNESVSILEKKVTKKVEIDWKDDLKKDVEKQIKEVQNKCSLLRNLAFSETEKFQSESKHDFTKIEPLDGCPWALQD